ncbi:MAG: TonB family protein [Acidobacteriota bacterium]
MQSMRAGVLARLLLIVMALLPVCAGAQSNLMADWETLRPEGEEFEISMPKNSTTETSKEPYHKMTLTTRLYKSAEPVGPVYAVTSMSGIKANPALYSANERLNSYVDAFKHWFPPKVRDKDAVATLALVSEKTLNGHQGREYRISIGNLSGSLQVFATRRRFYAVTALNIKKDGPLQKQFLYSFHLQEKSLEAPATVASQEPNEREPVANPRAPKPETRTGAEGSTETADETKPHDANLAVEKHPISGGVLNGKAISLPRPEYPAEARAAKAGGTVVVQVIIDEYGNVISAKAISGHPLLQPTAVNAASQARFSPTTLMGEPVKVTGVITYNFVAQ